MEPQEKIASGRWFALKPGWPFGRIGAMQWLIICGVGIVLAITLGTGFLVLQFRDRTVDAAERELANTAQLLSRHFDQQLIDLQRVHEDVLDYVRAEGIDTVEAFDSRMSSLAVHEMLRAKLQAFPHVGGLNLFNAQGWLINSTQRWPVPDVNVSDRRYFKEFASGQPVPETIVEVGKSKVTGRWTTLFARRILGRNGEIIGFASRSVEPSHFEEFCASLALDGETTISMLHHEGTIIARYPHHDGMVGRNIADNPLFQRILALNGSASGASRASQRARNDLGRSGP
jgi:hypothetical protein